MDTIYALASARGKAGVAVFRISGPKAFAAAEALCGGLPSPRRASVRRIGWGGLLLDEALVIVFPAGESFTGEPVVEFQTHGSLAVVQAIMRALAEQPGLRLAEAGCDVIVAQGGEAGGHCGEVSTIVLIPEVVRALKAAGHDVPVLAAGGIMTGSQMAACMAMGAAGAWTGSVWLATTESECSQIFREKMVAARSRDTVRSKGRTGKYSRQLVSAWTDAWEGPDSPGALPMPMQSLIAEPAIHKATKSAEGGNADARPLVTYFVGQGVGLVDNIVSARSVVQDFMSDYAEAVERLNASVG